MSASDEAFLSSLIIGITEADGASCPYCNATLKKFPKRSIDCPECKAKIFVAKRPADNLPVLLTKRQNLRVADEKRLVSEENFRKCYQRVESDLTAQFSRQPGHFDVMWRIYNEEILALSKVGDSLRGVHIKMVDLCFAEENFRAAINIILEMCVVDLLTMFLPKRHTSSEAIKMMKKIDKDMLRPEFSSIAGGVIWYLPKALEALNLKIDDFKQPFLEKLGTKSPEFWAEIDAEKAWAEVISQINKYSNGK